MNNCDTILNWMREQAIHKAPIDPMTWLEAAEKLNAMIGDEIDKELDLRQIVSQKRLEILEGGKSAVYARMATEATDDWKKMVRQGAKIGQIQEAIRLAKHHSRLKSEELRSGL